jgi:hypothetical protein
LIVFHHGLFQGAGGGDKNQKIMRKENKSHQQDHEDQKGIALCFVQEKMGLSKFHAVFTFS